MRRIGIGCLAIASLPLLVLGALAGPLWMRRVERLARRGRWGPRRSVALVPPADLELHWMAVSEEQARADLEAAFDALVELLPEALGVGSVERLELENPRTGFAIDTRRLESQPIAAGGAAAARMLDGERVEDGVLIVDGAHRLPIDLDARSFVTGRLSVSLPRPPSEARLAAARARFTVESPAATP